MKALVLNEYEADFKQIDLPKPQVKRGEVLIKVYSSGVNPIDNKIRIGKAPLCYSQLTSYSRNRYGWGYRRSWRNCG